MVDLRAMLHEEALDAGELVFLRGQHDDVQLQVGEVGAGQLEARGVVGILDVDGPDILSGTRSFRASIDSLSSSVLRGAS